MGSITVLRFGKVFSELIISSTMISKNITIYIFSDLGFRISEIFWDCPLSASVENAPLHVSKNAGPHMCKPPVNGARQG